MRDGSIWTVARNGSGDRPIVNTGDTSAPRWSPDGRSLLLTRGGGISAELFISVGGGPPRRLTSNARPESGAAWSPRGDQVAYALARSVGAGGRLDQTIPEEVWVVDTANRQERKVADGFDPAWSPDGLRLAYASNGRRRAEAPYGVTENAIHVVDVDGKNDRPILTVAEMPRDLEPSYGLPFRPGTFRLRAPAWAPNGRELVASADGRTGLAVTFDDRGQDVRVWTVSHGGAIARAGWSPRGDRLAVEVRPATEVDVVLLVDLARRRETRIGGPREGFQASQPSWSPNGRRLALISRPLAGPRRQDEPRELWTYTPTGRPIAIVVAGAVAGVDWNPGRP